jgi:hypothetical protein
MGFDPNSTFSPTWHFLSPSQWTWTIPATTDLKIRHKKKKDCNMKQSTTTRALQLCFLLAAASEVESHARFECPPPLSGRTGEKVGPCDVGTDDGSTPTFPLIPNAFNTVTWLESIPHPGAPVRFALSAEGGGSQDGSLDGAAEGFESCILLDHIPHDAWSKPSFRDELSWHRSSITL